MSTERNPSQAYWAAWYRAHREAPVVSDGWLEPFSDLIAACSTPVLDLGCGAGNDTASLLARGREVIPCDSCREALEILRCRFPEVRRTACFDLRESLPFPDGFTDLVVADLSLHYFSQRETAAILADLRRVLRAEGVLLFRVNSVKDVCHGAGEGREVEPNFYQTPDGRHKRFFDREDLRRFLAGWEELALYEETMTRYGSPKPLWTGAFCPGAAHDRTNGPDTEKARRP